MIKIARESQKEETKLWSHPFNKPVTPQVTHTLSAYSEEAFIEILAPSHHKFIYMIFKA